MNCPTQIFKRLIVLLVFFAPCVSAQAAVPIALTQIEKQEQVSRTRIIFQVSALPVFSLNHSGQRVELELTAVQPVEQLPALPEDEKLVKVLLAKKHNSLLVSMLLRRPPVEVVTSTLSSPARVVLDLFWEGDQGARPAVAFRIGDMPARKTGKKAAEYSNKSPWQADWRRFFADFRSDWQLKLPLVYSLPRLPQLVIDERSPLWPLQVSASQNLWLSLLRESAKITALDKEQAYLWRLLVAEAQLFSGALDASGARLQALSEEDGPQQRRVDYLTAYAQAAGGQPHLARIGLQRLLRDLPNEHPLRAPILLLAVETALAADQNRQALDYLQNSALSWPDSYQTSVKLRTADARMQLGELDAALALYADLVASPGLFELHRFSCNLAGSAAFKRQVYPLARQFYRKLSAVLKKEPGADLALWGLGAATYLAGDLEWGLIELDKATLEYPGTEGADRAALLLIDQRLQLAGELGMAQASAEYRSLGKQAGHWKVREEAQFKSALSRYLIADHAESVAVLMGFLRDFSSSSLKREAQLLLQEQIPTVVKQLLADNRELEAVVLVEKNRALLLQGGPDREFLHDLAKALERLGLYERSSRVLLFLLDQAQDEQQRQALYLPLARSFAKRGEFAMAGDYAGRYLKDSPRGKDSAALLSLLLDAFAAQGRDVELLAALDQKERPRSVALERRAAAIYWQLRRFPEVSASLEWLSANGGTLQVKDLALLGESYYQQRQHKNAGKLFNQLQDDPQFGTQAGYRSAQLLLQQQQRGAALKLLEQLVEKDADSAWGKLAQDLLLLEKSRIF